MVTDSGGELTYEVQLVYRHLTAVTKTTGTWFYLTRRHHCGRNLGIPTLDKVLIKPPRAATTLRVEESVHDEFKNLSVALPYQTRPSVSTRLRRRQVQQTSRSG